MIEAFKNNKKTTIWGILAITSEVLRVNPSIVSFLPDTVEGYVLGISSIIFAVMTVISARDRETPAQVQIKEIVKEAEKQQLKSEIRSETADLVQTAKELVEAKTTTIQVLPVAIPAVDTPPETKE